LLNVTRAGRRSGKILTTRVFGLLNIPREISFVLASQITFEEFLPFWLFKKWTEMWIKCIEKYLKCWQWSAEWKSQLSSTSELEEVTLFTFHLIFFCFFIRLAI
jgi:hypothetical protein